MEPLKEPGKEPFQLLGPVIPNPKPQGTQTPKLYTLNPGLLNTEP